LTLRRTDWNDLSLAVRDLVEARTGPVRAARTVTAGLNSQLAAVLDTENGPLFLKGLRTDHRGVARQRREAMINPCVLSLSPQLYWQAEGAGWNLLAFAYIPGARHADYSPESADLPTVVRVINRLQQIRCPDLPVKRAEQRWAAYVDDDTDLALLAGTTLLHTDFNPLNVLMTADGAWIIDWAWPTRGAAFIDPACFLLRLMLGGHTAPQAEGWAAQFISWSTTPQEAIKVFAVACARLYDEIGCDDPQPWKKTLDAVAQDWALYRSGKNSVPLAIVTRWPVDAPYHQQMAFRDVVSRPVTCGIASRTTTDRARTSSSPIMDSPGLLPTCSSSTARLRNHRRPGGLR
jgi:hypothetical protein